MNVYSSCLAFPIEVDERGTLRTINDPVVKARQFLIDLIETRLGEDVQVPGYGISDRAFSVMGATFVAMLAAELEEKVNDYLPIIDSLEVLAGESNEDGSFTPGFPSDQQRAALRIQYTIQGENTPRNLVYPTWRLLSGS